MNLQNKKAIKWAMFCLGVVFCFFPAGCRDKSAEYCNRGKKHIEKEQYDLAIAEFNSAIIINPKLFEAFFWRGVTYYNKGNYEKAIRDFNKTIKIKPKYIYAYLNRGNTYNDKGEHEKAITDYTKVIEINPRYAHAYNSRGMVYCDKGEYEQAISDFSKAILIDPSEKMLENAKKKQIEGKYGKFDYIQQGFLDISLIPNSVDVVIALFGVFQYLLELNEHLEALKRLYDILKPRGFILIDVMNYFSLIQR